MNRSLGVVVVVLALPWCLRAQTPAGSEFRVNTYTTDRQGFPSVALNADGEFVVVWESVRPYTGLGQDGSSHGVFGQRFSANGTARGSEFQVNSYTTGGQRSFYADSVAMDGDGNFVVVWFSFGQDGSGYGVFGRRFASNGTPLGSEFQVNSYTTADQRQPSVAMKPDGDFAVVWQSDGQDGGGNGVFGQRFAADGPPLGSEFQVNSYTTEVQSYPAVATDIDGNFVVVWTTLFQDLSNTAVFAQRFAASGTPMGGEFQVNTYFTLNQSLPSVAMDRDGDFVVVWESYGTGASGQDGSDHGVFGQSFNRNGTPVGGEFQVNSYTTGRQKSPSVAMDGGGNFVVVWESRYQDGSFDGVFGQRFSASQAPIGSEFQVNSHTTSFQGIPAVAADIDGDFVAVWRSIQQDGNDWGVFGQRYRVTASIGDRVWSDANVDGVQDPGESGISGVTVNLFNGGSAALVDTAVTDASGTYHFESLGAGDYFVEFVLPAGFVFSPRDQGADDGLDSDADPATGRTAVTSLAEAEDDLSWDAGMVGTSIGDRVWSDANVNGLQDPGEPGVAAVVVNLINASTGLTLDTTSADSNGLYQFRPLAPGNYLLEFVLPAGFVFTAADQGADNSVDSDAEPGTGRTSPTTLGENEMDSSWDAGLAPDDFLTLGVNQTSFSPGQPLAVSVLLNNTGLAQTADFYFGALLPDGDTIVFFTDLAFNAAVGSLSDVSTLSPMVSGVNLSAPFVFRGPGFFSYQWMGGEPSGSYVLFVAAVVPAAFVDGSVDPGDILGLSTVELEFIP